MTGAILQTELPDELTSHVIQLRHTPQNQISATFLMRLFHNALVKRVCQVDQLVISKLAQKIQKNQITSSTS